MKKISLFIALVIAALLSLGGQSAAMAFEHGPTLYAVAFEQSPGINVPVLDHKASPFHFKSADKLVHERIRAGVTDTVFMAPMGKDIMPMSFNSRSDKAGFNRHFVESHKKHYKDRPGWQI